MFFITKRILVVVTSTNFKWGISTDGFDGVMIEIVIAFGKEVGELVS